MKIMIRIATVSLVLAALADRVYSQGSINFGATPNGTAISANSFSSLGLLLQTDLGQSLYSSGSSLVASGNGHVTIEFFLPGTTTPGGVSSFSMYIADNLPGSTYTVTGYDGTGLEMFQMGNNHDYLLGDGYSFSPYVHTLEFSPSSPGYNFIDNITFSQIHPVPEPQTLCLATLGATIFILSRKRK